LLRTMTPADVKRGGTSKKASSKSNQPKAAAAGE
jgi:hypothetical protein